MNLPAFPGELPQAMNEPGCGKIAEQIRPQGMGIIVRTVAEGRSEEDLLRDWEYLLNLWNVLASPRQTGRRTDTTLS